MNKVYKSTIVVRREEVLIINDYLSGRKPMSKDGTITYTARFPDGKEMDVKVCPAEMSEGGPWTEAVLFNEKGGELVCTDCSDEFVGDWELEYDGDSYLTSVTEAA